MPCMRRGVQHPVGPRSPSVRPLRPEAEDNGEILLLLGLQVIVLEPGGTTTSSGDHHARLCVFALRQKLSHREVLASPSQDTFSVGEIRLRGLRQGL